MNAIVYERYGSPDVLEQREVDRPSPGEHDVLVRVHASAIGAGDWLLLTAEMFAVRLYQGLFRPKRRILGFDVAGVVEQVGAAVTEFSPGDEIYGECIEGGGFAECVATPARALARKPAGLSFEEAAALPVSALTALQGLRDHGRIRAGHRVLVCGASGGVGSYAVQIAKSYETEVTGTCSASKADFVRSLGADHVLDYRVRDFPARPDRYDLILDMAGKHPLADCKRCLTPDGIYVAVGGNGLRTLRAALLGGKRTAGFVAKPNRADLEFLAGLVEAGKLRPVVDRSYPLAEVPDALRRFGTRQVCGKVVISVAAP